MKAVLDTNVLISSVIATGVPHEVVVKGFSSNYQIIVSVATLTEFRETLLKYPDRFGLPAAFERQPRDALDGPLQIVLDPRPTLEVDHVDGYPVVPRDETTAYMREHYAQFQSALSMLDRMYDDLDLDVAYRESDQSGSSVSDVTDGIDGAR